MMMMGKSGGRKNPMRRTTSMTEFAPPADVLVADVENEEEEEADEATELEVNGGGEVEEEDAAVEEASYGWFGVGSDGAGVREDWLAAYRARAAPALAGLRRNSADFSAVETAAFLRACGLCNRRLGPGRDTFMYKGDTAFCSLECRQQHITHEEWKEKRALAIATAAAPPPPSMPDPTAAGSDNPAGGTLAAA